MIMLLSATVGADITLNKGHIHKLVKIPGSLRAAS
jgi:hypothetical protein